MKNFGDVTLGTVGGTRITLDDLLFQLRTNSAQTVIEDMVHAVVIRKMAEESAISVSNADLQRAADEFRRGSGLITAQETHEWMAQHGLTLEEFERKLEQDLLTQKVRERLATEDAKQKVFVQNILDFERAKIAQIVVKEAGLAREIRAQLAEGEAEFCALAAKHSTDKETAEKGGFVGYVNRKDLPAEVDAVVFAEGASGVLGPIASGGSHYVVKVLEAKKADFTDPETQAICTKMIFDEALAQKAAEHKTKLDF